MIAPRRFRIMARKSRRTFSAEFKLDTVLAGLRGEQSVVQICRERDISESQYHQWKAIFQERAVEVFRDRRSSVEDDRTGQVAELERLVGRLTMEVEILKKARSWLDTPSGRNGR
jgi:transposase-like protein